VNNPVEPELVNISGVIIRGFQSPVRHIEF